MLVCLLFAETLWFVYCVYVARCLCFRLLDCLDVICVLPSAIQLLACA